MVEAQGGTSQLVISRMTHLRDILFLVALVDEPPLCVATLVYAP